MRHPPYFALVFALIFLPAIPAHAVPYIPNDDKLVLESLPFKASDTVARELSELRMSVQRDPKNLELALRLARRYYRIVGANGDPRYLGYAQAALAPWWNLPQPPEQVLLVRASIRQFAHDFPEALSDLDKVLENNPQQVEALSLRAIIHIVQARYSAAQQDCATLEKSGDALIGTGCLAMIHGLTGRAEEAYRAISAAIKSASNIEAERRMWLLIRQAELALRLDRLQSAEQHFKEALALGIEDTFLLAEYADLLLEQRRYAEVSTLLSNKNRSDVLLLRIVLAEQAQQLPTASQWTKELAARFEAAKMRGDSVHQQEEARFALHVQRNVAAALQLALENWKVQREPRDAQIVLEAAVAAKDPRAAEPVLAWLSENRTQGHLLNSLAAQLREMRR